MWKLISIFIVAISLNAQPSGGGPGVSPNLSSCATTPPTTGTFGQQCIGSDHTTYTCPVASCTVAGDWGVSGSSPDAVSSTGMTTNTIPIASGSKALADASIACASGACITAGGTPAINWTNTRYFQFFAKWTDPGIPNPSAAWSMSEAAPTGTSTQQYIGHTATGYLVNGAGVAGVVGLLGQGGISATGTGGTTTYAVGVQGVATAKAGTVTYAEALSAGPPLRVSPGVITNAIGLHIEAQAGAGITNAWGIKQEGSELNSFGGLVESRANGFKFPDATIQTTAASSSPVPVVFRSVSQNTIAGTSFSLPASNAPALVSVEGASAGDVTTASSAWSYGTLSFAANSTANTANSVQGAIFLDSTWTSPISLLVKWRTSATTGNVIWKIQGQCVATGALPGSFGSVALVTASTAAGTTLQWTDTTPLSLTTSDVLTGCIASDIFMFRLWRDHQTSGDTLTATAELVQAIFGVKQ